MSDPWASTPKRWRSTQSRAFLGGLIWSNHLNNASDLSWIRLAHTKPSQLTYVIRSTIRFDYVPMASRCGCQPTFYQYVIRHLRVDSLSSYRWWGLHCVDTNLDEYIGTPKGGTETPETPAALSGREESESWLLAPFTADVYFWFYLVLRIIAHSELFEICPTNSNRSKIFYLFPFRGDISEHQRSTRPVGGRREVSSSSVRRYRAHL